MATPTEFKLSAETNLVMHNATPETAGLSLLDKAERELEKRRRYLWQVRATGRMDSSLSTQLVWCNSPATAVSLAAQRRPQWQNLDLYLPLVAINLSRAWPDEDYVLDEYS